MRKLFLIICLWCCCAVPALAQSQAELTPTQAREAEWKAYALPQTNFARQKSAGNKIAFRIPVGWKQEDSTLTFVGPHSASIRVHVQEIPDGYPLQEYVTSLLQAVRDNAVTPEATLTRKTEIQDLEAREIFLENTNVEGDQVRSVFWITVNGPLALSFNFSAPITHATELEPFFKAVVQSIVFLPRDLDVFENLRESTLKPGTTGPIHELETLVASLDELGVDREPAINRLASLYASQPDAAVDVLIDRRPIVRTAAVQALIRSNNSSLSPFLWARVEDRDLLVAEAAARVVAARAGVIDEMIEHSMFGHRVELIARLWPFISKDKRTDLLQRIFSQTARRNGNPPPIVKPGAPEVSVSVKELRAMKPGELPSVPVKKFSDDPNVQIGALTLLIDVPVEQFKLPLDRIIASNNDELIATALQVAYIRGETLAVDPLLKLVKSSDRQVSWFATQCLGFSAGIADIPRIEALISKDSKDFDNQLKTTIKQIRFRHELSNAKSANEQREIIGKASADAALAGFAWRYDCEATVAGCAPTTAPKRDLAVKPFGENLFPKKLRHYIAIPKPGEAVQKFYETLQGLQLDSPRSQASLALMLNGVRQLMAEQLNAPAGAASLLEYTGIDTNAPIALGAWTADKAADSTGLAQRRAIILRVRDRARFERLVQQFQNATGSFTNYVDYLAVGTRGIAALPAFLPFTAQTIASAEPRTKRKPVRKSFTVIGDDEWNGLRVRRFEQRRLNGEGEIDNYLTYLTFVGDMAIVTSDLATLRDLINNEGRPNLAENKEFRKAVEQPGDAIYFSDLRAVFADASEAGKPLDFNIHESGMLNIANASWENSHQLVFDESDWTKPLLPFHPKDLSAPRELLPASTIAYYLMNIDLKLGWSSQPKTLMLPSEADFINLWSVNLKDEVLPELGPECGAVVLELPRITDFEGGSWAAFCKLKSNKLAEALNAGKLFNGVGPAKDFAQIKAGAVSYFVAVRNGFLLVSNREQGLAAFDGKSNLAATRDYSRAVAKTPGNVLAFGGYNLEAAIAAAKKTESEGLNGQIANIIFSIASAFHSQHLYATATSGTIEAHSSVSMDREGRYSVSDFSELSKGKNITFASLEPTGLPIADQNRVSSLLLRVKAKAAGPIEDIKDDVKHPDQTVEEKSATELLLRVGARRNTEEKTVELPVKDPQFAPYLRSTAEFAADDEQVKKQAAEIAGEDRDAWRVARKLADWTHQNLEWKVVAKADARQTLATREADCSEFSSLFVAMARSLGLPARLVSGLAYSGDSFGGHAWVEVWAGKWIELDPTWGTHFVDATHIRNESSALVTSAALSLIELEVLEARRSVTEFQKTSKALTQHLIKAIPTANKSDIEAVLDLGILTDELMGAGSWSKMNDTERNRMASAYRRVLHEIIDSGYLQFHPTPKMRLLHLEEKDNSAEAICLLGPYNLLTRLRLTRRDGVWYLVEVIQSDTGLHTVAEAVRPTITSIENARAGRKIAAMPSDVARVSFLRRTNMQKALAVVEDAVKAKPSDPDLRFLKALTLFELDKKDEGIALFRELSNEGFVPAVYRLAAYLNQSEDEAKKAESITLYKRYTELEPYDSRGFRDLAISSDNANQLAQAEAAYRKSIELNPTDVDSYVNFVQFLIVQDRVTEVRTWIEAAEKLKDEDTEVFGAVMRSLTDMDDSTYAEKLAASEPLRMKSSAVANLALGHMYADAERYRAALPFLQAAAHLDKTSSEPHTLIAFVHRKQKRFNAALRAAQQAIAIDEFDGEARYQLACTLARLGRIKEAMTMLEKALETEPDYVLWMGDEPDLKPLARLPAFKKLLQTDQN